MHMRQKKERRDVVREWELFEIRKKEDLNGVDMKTSSGLKRQKQTHTAMGLCLAAKFVDGPKVHSLVLLLPRHVSHSLSFSSFSSAAASSSSLTIEALRGDSVTQQLVVVVQQSRVVEQRTGRDVDVWITQTTQHVSFAFNEGSGGRGGGG